MPMLPPPNPTLNSPASTHVVPNQMANQVSNHPLLALSGSRCSVVTVKTVPAPAVEAVQHVTNPQGTGISSSPERLIPAQWKQFETGPLNAITDVPNIMVGQVSLRGTAPKRINTGVTAIVPNVAGMLSDRNLANTGFRAAAITINGNGELTGMGPLVTSGVLNSPIILTSTLAVGVAHTGVDRYMGQLFPGQWSGMLPVVGECLDAFFSDPRGESPLSPQDSFNAITAAKSGPVSQGRVGAGTGMRSFELHAGVGSASRQVVFNNHVYTIGVLVNTNHSRLATLNPQIRTALEQRWGKTLETARDLDDADRALSPAFAQNEIKSRQGSIMVMIATDLPLDSQALKQLAERATLGIANMGSYISTSSGDFAVAFSTANPIPLGDAAPKVLAWESIHPDALAPAFQATVEAVTEAQLNAIVAAHSN